MTEMTGLSTSTRLCIFSKLKYRNDDHDEEEEDEEEEDDTAELLRELEKIKRERAEEKARQVSIQNNFIMKGVFLMHQ